MYAIYHADHTTDGRLRLFGVVKHEAVAVEVAKIFSFERRWDRYQLRYCRSPYLAGSIPQYAVYSFISLKRITYYHGFFYTREAACRMLEYMSHAYPGILFFIRTMSEGHELRASHMDTESALF